jgi:hypothetical protein
MDSCSACGELDSSRFTRRQWEKVVRWGKGRCKDCVDGNHLCLRVSEFQRKFAGDWGIIRRRVDALVVDVPGTVLLLIADPSVFVIPGGLFAGCKKLRGVIAPYINDIQNQAFFECDELVKVDAGGVLSVGANAFCECPKLEQVKVNNVRLVGQGAFRGCKKLQVVEMDGVEEIGTGAFSQCELLKEVRVPMLKVMRSDCFNECKALGKVTRDRGGGVAMEMAPDECFNGCDKLIYLAAERGFGVEERFGDGGQHQGIMRYLNWKAISNEQRHTLLMYLKMTADGEKEGEDVRATTSHKVMKFLVGNADITRHLVQFL